MLGFVVRGSELSQIHLTSTGKLEGVLLDDLLVMTERNP